MTIIPQSCVIFQLKKKPKKKQYIYIYIYISTPIFAKGGGRGRFWGWFGHPHGPKWRVAEPPPFCLGVGLATLSQTLTIC